MPNQDVHHSFQNISSNQEYDINVIIEKLTSDRDRRVMNLRLAFERVTHAVSSAVPVSHLMCDPQELQTTHNALLVAKSMKAHGAKTITLNATKPLDLQVIAQLSKETDKDLYYSAGVYSAKSKLGLVYP